MRLSQAIKDRVFEALLAHLGAKQEYISVTGREIEWLPAVLTSPPLEILQYFFVVGNVEVHV